MDFDFAVITDHWRFLASGVGITLLLSVVSGLTSEPLERDLTLAMVVRAFEIETLLVVVSSWKTATPGVLTASYPVACTETVYVSGESA